MRTFQMIFTCAVVCAVGSFWGTLPGKTLSHTPPQNVKDSKSIEGIWEGKLDIPLNPLRVVAHITRKPDGTLTALMDSPDQGAKGLPVASTSFQNGTLKLNITSVMASFEGKLSADGQSITGTFQQGGGMLPLTLKRVDKAPEPAAPRRPQEPKKPYPYVEREVTYENKTGGIKLAGTLTVPRGAGPFPAVLLITGSGAQDRDEALLGHRPFLVLADYLTRRGIAVLRVDDRGVGGSTGSPATATTMDFVGDVLAGVAFLKTQKEIDAAQIGLCGHSEGGLIAPIVASRSKDVAFIVLMAGTGIPGEEIIYLQTGLISAAMGAPDEAVAKQQSQLHAVIGIVKQEKDDSATKKRLRQFFDDQMAKLTPEERKQAVASKAEETFSAQTAQFTAPWFRYFLTLDPRPYLQKVTCPVLALNGARDLQVPPKQNLPAIEKALKAAGNKDMTILELPGLNHLFQNCTTGAPTEYAQIEETISPLALQAIGDWIGKHTHPAKTTP